jgi:hypothetical protein
MRAEDELAHCRGRGEMHDDVSPFFCANHDMTGTKSSYSSTRTAGMASATIRAATGRFLYTAKVKPIARMNIVIPTMSKR